MDQSFAHTRPFRFDTVFEGHVPMPVDDGMDEQLNGAALRAELNALRAARADEIAAAEERGARAAEERLRGERDEALLAAIDALHATWEEFASERGAMADMLHEEAVSLALAIGEKLAGQAFHADPAGAVDAAIGRALAMVERGQEIVVSVHPELEEATRDRLAERQAGDRRKLHVLIESDAALAPGDARLRWDGGAMRVEAAQRRAAVLAELDALWRQGKG